MHGGGGLWGVIAVPIFAKEQSIVFDTDKVAWMVRLKKTYAHLVLLKIF